MDKRRQHSHWQRTLCVRDIIGHMSRPLLLFMFVLAARLHINYDINRVLGVEYRLFVSPEYRVRSCNSHSQMRGMNRLGWMNMGRWKHDE